jgi:aspartokinase-like uncharacterized kinase
MSGVRTVVKVGGSLLDWPALPQRLGEYLKELGGPEGGLLVICGGGGAADVVRHLDAIHKLGEAGSHELAIRALDLTAHVLAAIVPGLVVVSHVGEPCPGRVPVLAPRAMLEEDESRDLPRTWEVTSDTIAAHLAARLGASSLVLLKSAPLPAGAGLDEAVRLGLVAPAFPRHARAMPSVSYRDLRHPTDSVRPLHREKEKESVAVP